MSSYWCYQEFMNLGPNDEIPKVNFVDYRGNVNARIFPGNFLKPEHDSNGAIKDWEAE